MKSAALVLVLVASASGQELAVRGPEPAVVRLGDRAVVTLSVTAPDDDVELGPLPSVADLEIVAGRRQRAGTATTWQIMLEPQRAGVFEVPPLLVATADHELTTEPFRLEATRDPSGAEYAFIELVAEHGSCYVHEWLPLRLRFGFEAEFARDRMLPLFRKELDVPVQVVARGLRDLATLPPPRGARPRSFALDDSVAAAVPVADEVRDGRTFEVLELACSLRPEKSGVLVLAGPLLRFAHATRFRQDFFGGRVAEDRREAIAYAEPLAIQVRPLPEAGRPESFGGAVGQFVVRAEAAPRELAVGESLRLVLQIDGAGNLERLEPPPLTDLSGFHVYGRIEAEGARSATSRRVVYDLTPLYSAVTEVPSIAFAFFDPATARYRTVRTAPIPLAVRPAAGTDPGAAPRVEAGDPVAVPVPVPGTDDIFDLMPVPRGASPRGRPGNALVVAVLVGPWVGALGLLALLCDRARRRRDPDRLRAAMAGRVFRVAVSEPGVDMAEAFGAFLAARLGCSEAAVIAPELGDRLRRAGVPAELASRADTLLEGLVAMRYGGDAVSDDPTGARAMVVALEQVFVAAEAAR